MSTLRVAATQMACSWDLPANLERAEKLVRDAAAQGAQVVLIQELFETPYFCIEQDGKHFDLAPPVDANPAIKRFQVPEPSCTVRKAQSCTVRMVPAEPDCCRVRN